MEEKTHLILTRKIQLLIDCEDKEERRAYYQRLFDLRDNVYKGANLVLSHQYLLDHLQMIPYLNETTKVKIADVTKNPDGILSTSRMNTTYRVLSAYYKGQMPASILSPLNQMLFKYYRSESLAYSRGERSLRNYKKGMPIPIAAHELKLANAETGREFKFKLLHIPFRTYLGKDKDDKRVLLQQTVVGMVKICSCALKVVNGKLFLYLAIQLPKTEVDLKPLVIAEACLGMEHPIVATVGKQYLQIGSKEEFLYRRLAIQSARQRAQKAASFASGGHGKKRKLIAVTRYHNKERNYIDSKLHLYSRKLIDFCIKQGAGTLLLVNQKAKEELAKDDDFVLRNWSYYGLITKIKYKAELTGINVIVE